ncbi:velvet factor-domain-containing protein [Entophlyctis helioformis]|nr:velvet factor-domain-containing protein [Entophlyctis helioformis]
MHASLWTSDMERSVLLFEGEQVLVGSLTSVMSVLRDEFGKQGVFFIFPDLSVRCDGIFRLRFSLMNLQGSAPNQLAQAGGPVIATIFTEPFEVFKPKLFPGVAEPTMLIKSFTLQGHPLPIRKFRRKRSSIAGGVETIITVPNTSTASARLPTSAPTSASISVSGTNTPSMAFAQLPMNPASSSFTPDGGGGDGSGGGGSRGTARTRGDGSASGPGSHAVAYSDSDTSFVLGSSALHEGEYEDYD